MKISTSTLIFIFAGLVFVGVIAFAVFKPGVPPGLYDDFAQCVTESGATMYGAYWCSHCVSQKEAFGDSIEYIDYVECAIPNVNGPTKECEDAGITGYPTWVFGDDSRAEGEVTFEQLSQVTGCELPTE